MPSGPWKYESGRSGRPGKTPGPIFRAFSISPSSRSADTLDEPRRHVRQKAFEAKAILQRYSRSSLVRIQIACSFRCEIYINRSTVSMIRITHVDVGDVDACLPCGGATLLTNLFSGQADTPPCGRSINSNSCLFLSLCYEFPIFTPPGYRRREEGRKRARREPDPSAASIRCWL